MGIGIFFQGPYAYPFSVPLPSFWALQIETVYAPFLPHFLQCLLFTQKEHRLLSGAEMSTCLQLRALYYSYLLCPLPVSIYSRGMVQLQAKAGIIFFPQCVFALQWESKWTDQASLWTSRVQEWVVWPSLGNTALKNPCIGWELHPSHILV